MAVEQEVQRKLQFLRVKVVDNARDGHPVVNITMPIDVVKWGMKIAQAFSPQMKDADVDWDVVAGMIKDGAQGQLVHVEDEAAHKTIDVWVE